MFENAFDCSFTDCLVPCAVTFAVVFAVLGIIHIFIYFKLVALAKQRFGETFDGGDAGYLGNADWKLLQKPLTQLNQAFRDPHPGITQLEDVRQEEVWQLYQLDRKNQANLIYPAESKYFNLLSTKFLKGKGYSEKQIKNYRMIGRKLSCGWGKPAPTMKDQHMQK